MQDRLTNVVVLLNNVYSKLISLSRLSWSMDPPFCGGCGSAPIEESVPGADGLGRQCQLAAVINPLGVLPAVINPIGQCQASLALPYTRAGQMEREVTHA